MQLSRPELPGIFYANSPIVGCCGLWWQKGLKMNTNNMVTQQQLKQMHTLLSKLGLMAYKQDMMDWACTDGRYPTSSTELYYMEAQAIIDELMRRDVKADKMRKKIIANCRQAGMSINGVADMQRIYEWVLKYGHAKKELNKYTWHELPQLINQSEALLKSYLKRV